MDRGFTDTHCHIQSAGAEQGERSTRALWAKAGNLTGTQLVAEAHQAGVERLVCVGCDPEDSRLAVTFAGRHEGCYASIGIHPHEAAIYVDDKAVLQRFAALAKEEKVIAVGECGLDYFYTHSPPEEQKRLLAFQLELAAAHDLPVIFHVREAFDDFWPIFDTYTGIRGVLHSFTDSRENLQQAVERGLYIGVNGIATFAKPPQQEVYKTIPLTNLLLETDAPFLTPVPFRGKICTPKHVTTTAAFLSGLRGEPLEVVREATTQNAQNLFKL